MLKQLLIVTGDSFPSGDAGAIRTECLSHAFEANGYEVRVIGFGDSTEHKWRSIDSIQYCSLRSGKKDWMHRFFDRCAFLLHIKQILRTIPQPEVICLVSDSHRVTSYLKRYAAKHGTRLIHDAVEWYSPEEFRLGKLARAYRNKDRNNRKNIDRQFSVIAISTFLENYFAGRGISTIRIPAVLDVQSISGLKHTQKDKTVFVYAGSPGKKDYLRTMLQGISKIEGISAAPFELRLFGVSFQQLTETAGVSSQAVEILREKLRCYGRVSRNEVLSNLSEADFTILLRPSELRYARAGFPTKVVESFATATPAVVNLSSDLSLYLKDGENCILAADCTEEAFAKAFMKAISISYEERDRMQQATRQTAEQYFDYRCYIPAIHSLLEEYR